MVFTFHSFVQVVTGYPGYTAILALACPSPSCQEKARTCLGIDALKLPRAVCIEQLRTAVKEFGSKSVIKHTGPVAYSDSSLTNFNNLCAEQDFIILLTANYGKDKRLGYFKYYRCRVVIYVLAGGTYKPADSFQTAYALQPDLRIVANHHFPLNTATDRGNVQNYS